MRKTALITTAFFITGIIITGWTKKQIPVKAVNYFPSVLIGKQIWMTQNLDLDTFRNGDPVPQARSIKEWKKAAWKKKPAWCYYRNDSATGSKYGKLYNFYAVTDPRGLAPDGWRIPTEKDWYELSEFLNGKTAAGYKMKNTTGWMDEGNGSNSSGFTALPGGTRDLTLISSNNGFKGLGQYGFWWSSVKAYNDDVYVFSLSRKDESLYFGFADQHEGLSVRCISK